MNKSYKLVESYNDENHSFDLIVTDHEENIKIYKYTNNIIKILEIENINELLKKYINVYDRQIINLSLYNLSSKKEEYIYNYLCNCSFKLSLEVIYLIQNNEEIKELENLHINKIYYFNSGIKKVNTILEEAKNNFRECYKKKKLVK